MIRNSAGGVIVGSDGKIVVVSQGDSWSLPKGHLESDEDEQAAAIREIHEESGLKEIKIVESLGSYERTAIARGGIGEDKDNIKHITMFLCTTTEKELEPLDPHNPEARWVEPGQVIDLLTHQKDKDFFLSVIPKIERLLSKP